MSEAERRCPSCGALAASDAEWCGQCLRPLREGVGTGSAMPATEGHAGSTGTAGAVSMPTGADGQPRWTCPVCEHVNPLERDRCERCDTPFTRLFEEPEAPVEVDPARAMAWSILLPGLGHRMVGRTLDGVARMVLFAWVVGTLVVLVASGVSGATAPLLLLYLVALVCLEVTSAVDARRLAAGEEPLVSSRALLWGAVALVGASVLLATFIALPAARGR